MNDIARTIFCFTLVQDSDLSVSGLDGASASDRPFTVIDGELLLRGSGITGAAVAMARRCFDPFPRCVSEDTDERRALRESIWRTEHARPLVGAGDPSPAVHLRSGVGLEQRTAARAEGVLFDHEASLAGTKWSVSMQVRWSRGRDVQEAATAEGILGYILDTHWQHERCWLGGSVSRGLGWCHASDIRAYRLTAAQQEEWLRSGRKLAAADLLATGARDVWEELPRAKQTRSWCFRIRDITISFGVYKPHTSESHGERATDVNWGIDGLAIGPHDRDRHVQPSGDGAWVRPGWLRADAPSFPASLVTDRALLMRGGRPLLPATAPRQAGRHALSRLARRLGEKVVDPHTVQGAVGDTDPIGLVFGTTTSSSRLQMRDAVANDGWGAAILHMHAEDEFSAGSFESAKRDAARLLQGTFTTRVVVEGESDASTRPLMEAVDRMVALGAWRQLPVGGHKSKGAGWGKWSASEWTHVDVSAVPAAGDVGTVAELAALPSSVTSADLPRIGRPHESRVAKTARTIASRRDAVTVQDVLVVCDKGALAGASWTLGSLIQEGVRALGTATESSTPRCAWWCEPTIDLAVSEAPQVFGWSIETVHGSMLKVDDVMMFASNACWRASRVGVIWKWSMTCEVEAGRKGAKNAVRMDRRVWSRRDLARFAVTRLTGGRAILREWLVNQEPMGFTIDQGGDHGR